MLHTRHVLTLVFNTGVLLHPWVCIDAAGNSSVLQEGRMNLITELGIQVNCEERVPRFPLLAAVSGLLIRRRWHPSQLNYLSSYFPAWTLPTNCRACNFARCLCKIVQVYYT